MAGEGNIALPWRLAWYKGYVVGIVDANGRYIGSDLAEWRDEEAKLIVEAVNASDQDAP